MGRFKFVGGRVFKTAVAIFITAWLCELLNWPPVFAVITAIVTIEPTVSDSIKKGIVRFPASAIGSAYAVIFISLFGNSPLTYTLAAFFTIVTCFKFKLHAGLLVATLTSVAMVEVIHTNLFVSFLIRLGTTTIGLTVSTLVNMFVLPPNYKEEILEGIQTIGRKTAQIIEKVFKDILEGNHGEDSIDKKLIKRLDTRLLKTETLIQFQKDESKYHPLLSSEKENFNKVIQRLQYLRLIHYHLDNLIQTPLATITWSKEERKIIFDSVSELVSDIKDPKQFQRTDHLKRKRRLMELFWTDNEEITKQSTSHPTFFPPELIVLYELLSIYGLVEKFHETDKKS